MVCAENSGFCFTMLSCSLVTIKCAWSGMVYNDYVKLTFLMTAPRGKARAVEGEGGGSSGGLRRSEAGSMVFVLPLRNRVLFPGLRAQALVVVGKGSIRQDVTEMW